MLNEIVSDPLPAAQPPVAVSVLAAVIASFRLQSSVTQILPSNETVALDVGVGVGVKVFVGVNVFVGVEVIVGVNVFVGVKVIVGVSVLVGVLVAVPVAVGVGAGG